MKLMEAKISLKWIAVAVIAVVIIAVSFFSVTGLLRDIKLIKTNEAAIIQFLNFNIQAGTLKAIPQVTTQQQKQPAASVPDKVEPVKKNGGK